jgi:hypothetical protein
MVALSTWRHGHQWWCSAMGTVLWKSELPRLRDSERLLAHLCQHVESNTSQTVQWRLLAAHRGHLQVGLLSLRLQPLLVITQRHPLVRLLFVAHQSSLGILVPVSVSKHTPLTPCDSLPLCGSVPPHWIADIQCGGVNVIICRSWFSNAWHCLYVLTYLLLMRQCLSRVLQDSSHNTQESLFADVC